jgi:hypothetical protein
MDSVNPSPINSPTSSGIGRSTSIRHQLAVKLLRHEKSFVLVMTLRYGVSLEVHHEIIPRPQAELLVQAEADVDQLGARGVDALLHHAATQGEEVKSVCDHAVTAVLGDRCVDVMLGHLDRAEPAKGGKLLVGRQLGRTLLLDFLHDKLLLHTAVSRLSTSPAGEG